MAIIRPALPSDAEALSAVENMAYAHYVDHTGAQPVSMTADFPSLIDSGGVWVAEQQGAVVGLLVLEAKSDHVLLDSVAVSPNAQGAGIGAQLLNFASEHARAHDLDEVRLYTHEARTENIDYYLRRGFVETHRATDRHGHRRVYLTQYV